MTCHVAHGMPHQLTVEINIQIYYEFKYIKSKEPFENICDLNKKKLNIYNFYYNYTLLQL